MTQTKSGSQKAAATLKAKDPDHFKKIGRLGGTKSRGGGFTGNSELARRAGAIGGTISRRKPKYQWVEDKPETLFVDEAILIDEEFGEGFFRPTLRQRVLNKIRSL